MSYCTNANDKVKLKLATDAIVFVRVLALRGRVHEHPVQDVQDLDQTVAQLLARVLGLFLGQVMLGQQGGAALQQAGITLLLKGLGRLSVSG